MWANFPLIWIYFFFIPYTVEHLFFTKPRHHLKPCAGLIFLLKAYIAENNDECDLSYNSQERKGWVFDIPAKLFYSHCFSKHDACFLAKQLSAWDFIKAMNFDIKVAGNFVRVKKIQMSSFKKKNFSTSASQAMNVNSRPYKDVDMIKHWIWRELDLLHKTYWPSKWLRMVMPKFWTWRTVAMNGGYRRHRNEISGSRLLVKVLLLWYHERFENSKFK